jgi:hypothetical protein
MCECYQIGGRFIAEDPDCEVHGTQAQIEAEIGERERDQLQERIEAATTLDELRSCMLELLATR